MKIEQTSWSKETGWSPSAPGSLDVNPQVVLIFAGNAALEDSPALDEVRKAYPDAQVFGCSTAGEICGTRVTDDSLVATAVYFEHSRIAGTNVTVPDAVNSYDLGKSLAASIEKRGLVHAFVLSDGLKINGSELVKGVADHLPKDVTLTGGLSGDGGEFKETHVIWSGEVERDAVAIMGLYGDRLTVGYGSQGGWDPYGPERIITRSDGNVLYELDGRSALDLYKRYLGEHAAGLPATALLFPLSLSGDAGQGNVVRTVLAVSEDEQSMTFAGDLREGSYARLMKADFDRIIGGARGAATVCRDAMGSSPTELAILISCVGRKMVLKERTTEEVEAVQDVLGSRAILTGFYSYGEIAPFVRSRRPELHNQTMTITTLSEQ